MGNQRGSSSTRESTIGNAMQNVLEDVDEVLRLRGQFTAELNKSDLREKWHVQSHKDSEKANSDAALGANLSA